MRTGCFPDCKSLHDIELLEEHPVCYGGNGDIYRARWKGQVVGVKVSRGTHDKSDRAIKVRKNRAFDRHQFITRSQGIPQRMYGMEILGPPPYTSPYWNLPEPE